MSRVPISDLAPGGVLLRPVVNKNGLVLIAEGIELTDSLIEKIRNMEVDSVYIRGSKKIISPCDEMLADLDKRFGRAESEPFMSIIKSAISSHIMSLYEEDGSEDSQG